jgi:hypothetical protein
MRVTRRTAFGVIATLCVVTVGFVAANLFVDDPSLRPQDETGLRILDELAPPEIIEEAVVDTRDGVTADLFATTRSKTANPCTAELRTLPLTIPRGFEPRATTTSERQCPAGSGVFPEAYDGRREGYQCEIYARRAEISSDILGGVTVWIICR